MNVEDASTKLVFPDLLAYGPNLQAYGTEGPPSRGEEAGVRSTRRWVGPCLRWGAPSGPLGEALLPGRTRKFVHQPVGRQDLSVKKS